jgi:hypothetical protein
MPRCKEPGTGSMHPLRVLKVQEKRPRWHFLTEHAEKA